MPILTTILAILYGFGLLYWLKRGKRLLNSPQTKVLLWLHGFAFILFTISLWISSDYGFNFRGRFTFRIIAWIFLITGVLSLPLGHKSQFNIIMKVYFFIFSSLPTLLGLFLLVPFIGVVIVFSLFYRLSGTGDTVFFNDKNFRIQNTFQGVLGPPRLDVFKKEGIFERRIYTGSKGWYYIDSIRVKEQKDSLLVLIYHDKSEDSVSPLRVTVKR